jgi:hypothetical protein
MRIGNGAWDTSKSKLKGVHQSGSTPWAVQRARYMTLETMATLSDDAIVGLPAMVI